MAPTTAGIPSLAALRAFEATVRLGGLARAASELNVSTSAVSHQIRGLEESLGVRLLDRSTGIGGIRITPAGTKLLAAATGALTLLDEACAHIRGTTKRLTVSANISLSTMWLARRLAEFSALYPETPVNAIIQIEEPDFVRYGIDLAIVHVRERALRADDVVLLREEVFPVCSPDLHPSAAKTMGRCRLLQEAHEDSPEIDWRSWVSMLGLPDDFETRIVRYTSFSQVIGAAVGGAGLALGRSPLIDPELTSGRLVRLSPDLARPASWRFVLRRGPGRRHRMLERLIDFLCAEAAASTPGANSGPPAPLEKPRRKPHP
jgi:LysR family glycine cleavage system transcriptional activator